MERKLAGVNNMQMNYCHEGGQNYMVLQDVYLEGYQSKMLLENKIPGLLQAEVHWIDNRGDIYYNITGKKKLVQIGEVSTLKRDQIRLLLEQVLALWTKLEEYLLPQGKLWLTPESIYIKTEGFEVGACYIPKSEENNLSSLMEYLLEAVSYQDEEAVKLAYALYQAWRNYGEDKEALLSVLSTGEKEVVTRNTESTEKTISLHKNIFIPESRERPEKNNIYSKVFNYLACHSLLFQRFMVKKGNSYKKEKWKPSKLNTINDFQDLKSSQSKMTELLTLESPEKHTELLNRCESQVYYKLISEKAALYSDILIDRYPFIIGNGKENADGVIDSSVISRHHAQIENINNEIWIYDLKSTNGTKVNDVILKEKLQLNQGDRVCFADITYIFEPLKDEPNK